MSYRFSERARAQRREAGRTSWRSNVARCIAAHPGDVAGAALHLTGWLRATWLPTARGVTSAYIERMEQELAGEVSMWMARLGHKPSAEGTGRGVHR